MFDKVLQIFQHKKQTSINLLPFHIDLTRWCTSFKTSYFLQEGVGMGVGWYGYENIYWVTVLIYLVTFSAPKVIF